MMIDTDATDRRSSTDRAITVAWIGLVLATVVIWWLGGAGGAFAPTRGPILVAIVVIAFIKIHVVMQVFMDARSAPWRLQLTLVCWALAVCLGVLFFIAGLS